MYCPYFECVNRKDCIEVECDTLECNRYGCNNCEYVCEKTCPGIESKKNKS